MVQLAVTFDRYTCNWIMTYRSKWRLDTQNLGQCDVVGSYWTLLYVANLDIKISKQERADYQLIMKTITLTKRKLYEIFVLVRDRPILIKIIILVAHLMNFINNDLTVHFLKQGIFWFCQECTQITWVRGDVSHRLNFWHI